jgi:hypothetical protein
VLLWVVVITTQLAKLVIERNQGKTISMCAVKAGMSRKTAGKYLSQKDPLEQSQLNHNWGTRKYPLEAIWPRALEMLRDAPNLEAKALFEHLMPASEGKTNEKHLRRFQRRVRKWRLPEGPAKDIFFT